MRLIALGLVISLFAPGVDSAFAQQSEAATWQQVAAAIPLGHKVKVQLVDGKRISGTLMRVDSSNIMVRRSTRRPEPPLTIRLDEVSQLERDSGGGASIGKAIGIGLATGAGVILSLFIIALQFD
jgi:small nuclear ribonucleoprotein (snRNP)-like protein